MAIDIHTHTTADCGTTHTTIDTHTSLLTTMIDTDTTVDTQAMMPILMPSMELMSRQLGTHTSTHQ